MRSAPGKGERSGSGAPAVRERDVADQSIVIGGGVDARIRVREWKRDDGDPAAVVADHTVVSHDHAIGAHGEDAGARRNQPDDVLARQDGIGPVVVHDHVALDEHVLGHGNRNAGEDEGDDAGRVSDRRVVADDESGGVLDLDPDRRIGSVVVLDEYVVGVAD
jgi:hypothetical protein